MLDYVVAYVTCLVVIGLIDVFWLTVAKGLYLRALGSLVADKPNLFAGGIFYLVYPLGIVFFAVAPAIAAGQWQRALELGLLFGFFNYATYDLTNWAVIRGWPASPLAFDLPWGTMLTGAAATAAYWATTLV